MGFIVMNEAFDMWKKGKNPYDYSLYWDAWHEQDLCAFILRDRNHPSVFLWSIGSEILEQWRKDALRGEAAAASGLRGLAIESSLFAPAKRLRPLLSLLVAEVLRGDPGSVLPAACGIEMVHTASLVLDDLPGMRSPRGFDRMALPYLQRIFDAFPGLVRVYHNDTPCAHLLPRIGQLHCEVWNFSHEMDIAAVRAAAPQMALLGNVSPLDTLVRGTPDQVFREARACVEKVGAGGGFILSAGGGLSPGTPADHIDALVRAARG